MDHKFNYHYNREERLKTLSCEVKDRKRTGFLKGNKALIILLLDIVLIVIITVFIFPFINSISNAGHINGCSVLIKGFKFDGKTYLSVKIKRREERKENDSRGVKIEFYYEDSKILKLIHEVFPAKKNVERIFHYEIDNKNDLETIFAKISAGSGVIKIKTVLKKDLD